MLENIKSWTLRVKKDYNLNNIKYNSILYSAECMETWSLEQWEELCHPITQSPKTVCHSKG